MTDDHLVDLTRIIDERLTKAEERLTKMVNERNTNVIDATTALVQVLREEIGELSQALENLHENVAGRRSQMDMVIQRLEQRIEQFELRGEMRTEMLRAIHERLPPRLTLPPEYQGND